jgi:hypothetical protein
MGDRAAGKTYTTLVWEDEDLGQRFKGCVVGDGRQEEREEASVGNEMFVIVEVLAEARRCPLMSSIHRSAWNRDSRKFTPGLTMMHHAYR